MILNFSSHTTGRPTDQAREVLQITFSGLEVRHSVTKKYTDSSINLESFQVSNIQRHTHSQTRTQAHNVHIHTHITHMHLCRNTYTHPLTSSLFSPTTLSLYTPVRTSSRWTTSSPTPSLLWSYLKRLHDSNNLSLDCTCGEM